MTAVCTVNLRLFAASADNLLLGETLSRPLLLFWAPQSDLRVRLIVTVPFGNALCAGRDLLAEFEELAGSWH